MGGGPGTGEAGAAAVTRAVAMPGAWGGAHGQRVSRGRHPGVRWVRQQAPLNGR